MIHGLLITQILLPSFTNIIESLDIKDCSEVSSACVQESEDTMVYNFHRNRTYWEICWCWSSQKFCWEP